MLKDFENQCTGYVSRLCLANYIKIYFLKIMGVSSNFLVFLVFLLSKIIKKVVFLRFFFDLQSSFFLLFLGHKLSGCNKNPIKISSYLRCKNPIKQFNKSSLLKVKNQAFLTISMTEKHLNIPKIFVEAYDVRNQEQ